MQGGRPAPGLGGLFATREGCLQAYACRGAFGACSSSVRESAHLVALSLTELRFVPARVTEAPEMTEMTEMTEAPEAAWASEMTRMAQDSGP